MERQTPIESAVSNLLIQLQSDKLLKTASVILSPSSVVRLTKRHKHYARASRHEFVLTIGKPNYLAAKLVKRLKKDNAVFPVQYVMSQKYPVKKKQLAANQIVKKLSKKATS